MRLALVSLILLLVLSVITSEGAVVIFQENFDSGSGNAWDQIDVNGQYGYWEATYQLNHSSPNSIFFNSSSSPQGSSTRMYFTNKIYFT